MDFTISEQMETILEMVDTFVDDELIPLEGEMLFGDDDTLARECGGASGSVTAMTMANAEPSADEVNHFWPLMT